MASSPARVVIVGGGPGGYESGLVAAQLGAEVTIVDTDGLGGSAVLTDCVPSKTLIATAELMTEVSGATELGVNLTDSADGDDGRVESGPASTSTSPGSTPGSSSSPTTSPTTSPAAWRRRACTSSAAADASTAPTGCWSPSRTAARAGSRPTPSSSPPAPPRAPCRPPSPDGERILTWEQVYDLTELPSHLIVVGSGVTGAEFASAYLALGAEVTLVSSRDRVLPGEDADAAGVLEEVLTRRGMRVLSRSRMESVTRDGDSVTVTLTDGRAVEGSHCILAVGSVPNTQGLGLEKAGVATDEAGFVTVDRVSRTTARGVYAAGDCTGVLMLASVAAMQGRIAMWHFLGDAVSPLDLKTVSSNVFTAPEIATVGWSQEAVDKGEIEVNEVLLPLAGNARAKMQGVRDGFVKLFCRPGTGIVVGGVVVAPRASELIHPVSIAVAESLTADQLAQAFTVYPSMSGSVAEAARRLHRV